MIASVTLLALFFFVFPLKFSFANDTPVSKKQPVQEQKVKKCSSEDPSNTGSMNPLCPLKYIVYFLLFSFAIVFGAIIFVGDLLTGLSEKLTRHYIIFVKGKAQSVQNFFCSIGCPEE